MSLLPNRINCEPHYHLHLLVHGSRGGEIHPSLLSLVDQLKRLKNRSVSIEALTDDNPEQIDIGNRSVFLVPLFLLPGSHVCIDVPDGINRAELKNINGVIRINWTRGESEQRGIDISKTSLHSFWLEIDSYQPNFESISTIISQTERRNSFSRLSSCKTFSYNQGIQARIEAKNLGFHDALYKI